MDQLLPFYPNVYSSNLGYKQKEMDVEKEDLKSNDFIWVLVVLVIVIILIVYVISLGRINVGYDNSLPVEFKDSKESAFKRHRALSHELSKNRTLKKSLDKRFATAYFFSRFLIVLISIILIFTLGNYLGKDTISGYLELYNASILLIVIGHFLISGTKANFRIFIKILRTRVENWVWSKYVDLPKQMKAMESEMISLEIEMGYEIIKDKDFEILRN
jgi:hypothetical protein